jgi:hypothetical protein
LKSFSAVAATSMFITLLMDDKIERAGRKPISKQVYERRNSRLAEAL